MVTAPTYTKEEVLSLLATLPDPEIPVVSIQEIGMLRDVQISPEGYEILLSPTYTGCPAMGIIEADIRALLAQKGIGPVTVRLVYSPAWTTDWITAEAREKMRQYGIAPPGPLSCGTGNAVLIHCPICDSADTELVSRFGSTACKALYHCRSCQEPFEHFKCH